MADTEHLTLHAIDAEEGRRIVARTPDASDNWAEDYPFEGDLGAIGGLLRAWDTHGDPRPFGYYRISRRSDGLAVGGIGFKGRPVDGRVEIGYGLAPSGRGHGHAAEAVTAILRVAAANGVEVVLADTDLDNVASQRTVERAGFQLTGVDELRHYARRV